MRKPSLLLLLLCCFCSLETAAYTDHRFHNVDSLETIMSHWTAADLLGADTIVIHTGSAARISATRSSTAPRT